jgi:MFS family permease
VAVGSASAGASERADTGFRGAWRHRQWRLLLGAFVVSATGSWLCDVALLAWLLDRTGSAAWIAAAELARIVPGALLGSFAGVLADRWDRRRLLVSLDLSRAALMLLLAAIIAADGAPIVVILLIGVNSLLGIAYRPAIAAATPQVVDERSLAAANAAEGAAGQITWFLGPAIGALVLALSTPAWAFVVNGATFVVSALLLVRLRLRPLPTEGAGERRPSFFDEFREGLSVARGIPEVVVVIGLSAAALFAFGFEQVLHVLVAQDRLGIGAKGLGWMTAAMGVGGLAAAPLTMRAARTHHAGQALAVSGMLMGLPLALLAVVTSPWVAAALLFFEGIGNILFEVLARTLLQRLAPASVLGRVFGLESSAAATANLLGAVLAPILVGAFSLEAALLIGGGALVAYAVAALPSLARAGRASLRVAGELEPRVDVLARLPFLEGAGPEVLESIAAAVAPQELAVGAVVLAEGGPADDLYVVRSGRLDVSVRGTKVNEVGPDDVVGEIGVIYRRPRAATVTTRTPALLWRIPGGAFLSAIERHDIMPDGLRRGIADRLAQLPIMEVTA